MYFSHLALEFSILVSAVLFYRVTAAKVIVQPLFVSNPSIFSYHKSRLCINSTYNAQLAFYHHVNKTFWSLKGFRCQSETILSVCGISASKWFRSRTLQAQNISRLRQHSGEREKKYSCQYYFFLFDRTYHEAQWLGQ